MSNKLLPKRPYLLRAYYDWLVDNNFTPYLVVDATYVGVNVPVEYIKDGQIVLNISTNATDNLLLNNQVIQFTARFQGVPTDIYIPMGAVLAIYARENGDGVMFEPEAFYDVLNTDVIDEHSSNIVKTVSQSSQKRTSKDPKARSHLRIVK